METTKGIQALLKAAARQRGCTKPQIKYLAADMGVAYQTVQKWIDKGHLPIKRALQAEKMYRVCRISLMDPVIVKAVSDGLAKANNPKPARKNN